MNQLELNDYLSKSIKSMLKSAFKKSLQNPKEAAFLAKSGRIVQKSVRRRKEMERKGYHIPPFFIGTVTSRQSADASYAVKNYDTSEKMLAATDWDRIFHEAESLGISSIILSGEEPFLRNDVMEKAATHQNIIFPIIVNGTHLSPEKINFFDLHRNLVPIIHMERRPKKVNHENDIDAVISQLNQTGIFFGVIITTTTECLEPLTSKPFIERLTERGCRIILYLESEPKANDTDIFNARKIFQERLNQRRKDCDKAIIIAFPNDEEAIKETPGAGYRFFRILPDGAVELFPHSIHFKMNLKTSTLKACLQSQLFQELQEGTLDREHICYDALFY